MRSVGTLGSEATEGATRAGDIHRTSRDGQNDTDARILTDTGIPVITSQSWDLEEMPEAGYDTNGHLLVIVGFTHEGDPIINDPASNSNANVRSIYTRENFEKVWQESTGGVAYVYHPNGTPLPGNLPGVTSNW